MREFGGMTMVRSLDDAELSAAIASRLREQRLRSGLRQRDAAASAGITQAALSYYERGIRAVPLKTALRLAVLFGVTLDALLEGLLS